jgi:hypothetical protein
MGFESFGSENKSERVWTPEELGITDPAILKQLEAEELETQMEYDERRDNRKRLS